MAGEIIDKVYYDDTVYTLIYDDERPDDPWVVEYRHLNTSHEGDCECFATEEEAWEFILKDYKRHLAEYMADWIFDNEDCDSADECFSDIAILESAWAVIKSHPIYSAYLDKIDSSEVEEMVYKELESLFP